MTSLLANSPALHPLWLRFTASDLEERFRADHAGRSGPYLRALLVLMLVVCGTVGVAVLLAREPIAAAGYGPLYAAAASYPVTLVLVSLLYVGLFVLTYLHPGRSWHPHVVASAFLLTFLVDAHASAVMGTEFWLGSTLVHVLLAYLGLRLLLPTAVALGLVTTLSAVAIQRSTLSEPLGSEPRAVVEFSVHVVFLIVANVLGAFAAHHIERLSREGFFQRDLVERHAHALESALYELERTEAERIEAEKQASLSRLVAGLIHELNSPIGALASSADTLLRSFERTAELAQMPVPTAAVRERALRAVSASRKLLELQRDSLKRISELVSGLSAFVSADPGQPQRFDLRTELERALLRVPTETDGITLALDVPSRELMVFAEAPKVAIVLENVVDNAVRALKGRGKLSVRVSEQDSAVLLRIEDDGPGISADMLAELFEPRLTSDGPRVKLRLGLPTAKRLIEACGGSIQVESAPQRGTTVLLSLPTQRPSAESPARPRSEAQADDTGPRPL
jgi:signal transduction histidine kinase